MRHAIAPGPFAGVLLLVLASGCVSVEKSFPEKRTFILDVSRGRTPIASLDGGPLLRIRRLRVSSRYEGKGFVYRKGDLSYQSDFYNEFLIPPATLLTEELRQWLAGSGIFRHVTDSASQLQPTYVLEGSVSDLYGDYRNADSPRAVLRMQLFLIRDVPARSDIVFQKDYEGNIPIDAVSPEALVKGWNQALLQILTALQRDLRQLDFKAVR